MEHSQGETDGAPPEERDLELVRAALSGLAGPRAVLSGRLQCVPLAVAEAVGADGATFRLETRAAIDGLVQALPSYDGGQPLEDWALARVRAELPNGSPAERPRELADTLDVETLVRRALGAPAQEARRRLPFRRLLKLLPALGVGGILILFLWEDPVLGPDPDQLRGGDVRLLAPVGETGGWGSFEWSASEDVEGYAARVVVQMPNGEVLRSGVVDTPSWTPTSDQLQRLGDNLTWRVIEGTGLEQRRGWARAWLPPR